MNKKPRTLGKKVALSLLSLLVFALLAEGALRVRQKVKYGTFRNTVFSQRQDESTGLNVPEPNSETGGIRINALGFRSPELTTPKPEGAIRIAFLGGSTTYCAEATDNDATWPYVVMRGLRERHPDATFDFLNAAVPGYGTEHSLVTLKERVAQHART